MPVTFTAAFRVRHYECDAYGHLNNVNYIRYMQETALDATAAVGRGSDWYAQAGYTWRIYDTDIEYLQPLLHNDQVEVTTWVEDFRRVRSRRVYEFRRAGSPDLAARAATDWIFLDAATLQPRTIPPAVIQAYMPDASENQPIPRAKLPVPPPPPPGMYTLPKRVEWRDIDTVGHVNNAAYFNYIEDVSTQVGRHFGWSMPRMLAEGVVMVMRQMRIVYLQPALMDDDLLIHTWLSDAKRISVVRHYLLERPSDGAKLAQARGLWVCFDLKTQRPIRITPAMMEAFASNVAETAS
jgi:acyl-CoA thioester hydrolase